VTSVFMLNRESLKYLSLTSSFLRPIPPIGFITADLKLSQQLDRQTDRQTDVHRHRLKPPLSTSDGSLIQESLADANISVRQQCVRRTLYNKSTICDFLLMADSNGAVAYCLLFARYYRV